MKNISNELIVEAYVKAVLLDANKEFITLLEREIKTRGLQIEEVFGEKR